MKYSSIDLEKLRKNDTAYKGIVPFPHQVEAFEQLSKVFTFPSQEYKGGLLVLPTGAGKTFTSINWISKNVISKGKKVLWLAHSSSLLDQAYETFSNNAINILPNRKTLNIRVVSSNPSHCNSSTIETTDDVLIVTSQTAIANYNTNIKDKNGNKVDTYFERFIKENKDSLFVVLDEAHHAPAYGCRNLLLGLREQIPNLYILGLTATPTYTDKSRRGWLGEIFNVGIVYGVEKAKLMAQDILAVPKYIEKPTGKEFEVDDKLYNRLVKEHKDLPNDIIERLANDSARNDYIVNEYIKNKDEYGKTIIFADRWFQCVYLKEKLIEKGIDADAVFSKIDARAGSVDERNKRTTSDNERILNEFKEDKHQVLINVRMLTEGVDVPDVKTVFITRQTTSSILMTQMIGRALRGKRAGGKDKSNANIVLFNDKWKKLINWASENLDGGKESGSSITTTYPLEYISIKLVEDISKAIDSGLGYYEIPFLETVPVGWYKTEIVINTSEEDEEEMQAFTEFVMVYNNTKNKIEKFMEDIFNEIPKEWGDENLDVKDIIPKVNKWIEEYFNKPKDDIGDNMQNDIIKIIRHIAQNGEKPEYYSFNERDKYDLMGIAENLIYKNSMEQNIILKNLFNEQGSLWQVFYGTYPRFKTAFDCCINTLLLNDSGSNTVSDNEKVGTDLLREPDEKIKARVKQRDNYTCLCCGSVLRRGLRLEVDHILPFSMRGRTEMDNLQTLCKKCNNKKGKNEINFRDVYKTPLSKPKELECISKYGSEEPKYSLQRTINFFYHCNAVSKIYTNKTKRGKYYDNWRIELYEGNPAEWLEENKDEILDYIRDELGCEQVRMIEIVGA